MGAIKYGKLSIINFITLSTTIYWFLGLIVGDRKPHRITLMLLEIKEFFLYNFYLILSNN